MVTEEEYDWLAKQSSTVYCESCYQEIDLEWVPVGSKLCKSCIQILEKIAELEEDDGTILFN